MVKRFDGSLPGKDCEFASLDDFRYFSNHLRFLLISTGRMDSESAKSIGLDRVSISRYLNNTRRPELAALVKMSRYFNMSINDLIGAHIDTKSGETEIEYLYSQATEDEKKIIETILAKYKD